MKENTEPSSGKTCLAWCFFMGIFGAHRMYVNKIRSGLIMLSLTLIATACFLLQISTIFKNPFGNYLDISGILAYILFISVWTWAMIDLTLILINRFKDVHTHYVLLPKTTRPGMIIVTLAAWLAWFVVLFVLFLMCTMAFIGIDLSKHVTIEAQMIALAQGDIERSYGYTSTQYQIKTPLTKFEEFVQSCPALLREDPIINKYSRTLKNGNIYTRIKRTSEKGEVIDVRYILVEEDSLWLIDSIKCIRRK